MRPMYWSLRRELWENRSIYLVPIAVAAFIVIGSFFAGVARALNAAKLDVQPARIAQPFDMAAGMLMGTTFIVAIFYCLDALNGERRDRSVLFWKSLPVSDRMTVMSKAAIPFVVLPLVTFVVTIATQLAMLLLGSVVMMIAGKSAMAMWALPWLKMSSMLLYHLITVHSLYYAPFFGWMLFVSAWARRAVWVWAFLPVVTIGFVEKIVFNTSRFAGMLGSRMTGDASSRAGMDDGMMLGPFAPGEFLSKPGLWIGLAITAVFLVAAVRLRRERAPL